MKNLLALGVVLLYLASCKNGKQTTSTVSEPVTAQEEKKVPEPEIYNPSRKKINDLLHTKLDVKFDYAKSYLYGKANLTFKPHFYSTSTLELDAKGFDIAKVELVEKKTNKPLTYKYDGRILNIDLGRTYEKTDTFQVYIEYTAKPNELKSGGSSAISSDKGLYFINPDSSDKNKPTQIWTQGETEASSAWYPTIDSPNEKTSQEICMTVNKKFVTLSNGLLMFSTDNGDGTRTDCWKQELPHAPYLTMMAVGDFAIIKDKWRNLDVHYYVEKEYEKYARNIFGNTPEMLEVYSKLMGVDYPWDKYHQIVVRDYVSGAMENTGAVIHGEFLQKTDRELLDDENESIIAHELFHHWFGDLVTAESWANLPLNESFATYGEYLWIDHKYGRDEADMHIEDDLHSYLREAQQKQVDMIRFDYEDKEDMFDSHSYAKGGRILHMLRNYTGDAAFFASLKEYLTTNKFKSAEIHDLRLAFEKVTGEDMNWFFNQWFLASGHPVLNITTGYDETAKKAIVTIEQKQDFETTPLYKLPIAVDIYANGKKERHKIIVTKASEEFRLDAPSRPDLVNVDADKMLLAAKREKKSAQQLAFQYRKAPLYLDRYSAVEEIIKAGDDSLARILLVEALEDKHWDVRTQAIRNLKKVARNDKALKEKLTRMSMDDKRSDVRVEAIRYLSANYKDEDLLGVYKTALKDSAYSVVGAALNAISGSNEKEALTIARTLENEKSTSILTTIAALYATAGTDADNTFFLNAEKNVSSFNKFPFLTNYTKFLKRSSDATINEGLPMLEDVALNEGTWWMRLAGVQALGELYTMYETRITDLNTKLKQADISASDKAIAEQNLAAATAQKEKVHAILKKIKEKETDQNLQRFLSVY